MHLPAPSSRATIKPRFAFYDVAVAAFSPLLALGVRDASILSNYRMLALYCCVSTLCTLAAFWAFHIESIIPRYFSLGNALTLGKAVVVGELLTAIAFFSFTRLDGVPRSVPAIHALIVGAGLIAARTFVKIAEGRHRAPAPAATVSRKNIILIGLNDLSVLFLKFLWTVTPGKWQVIALLDADSRLHHRLVHGVRVFGPPAHLATLIAEFMVHGIRTDRVIMGHDQDAVTLAEIERTCGHYGADLAILPDFFSDKTWAAAEPAALDPAAPQAHASSGAEVSRYFRYKARVEAPIAFAMLLILAPVLLIASALAFIDVGLPIVFWQRRIGRQGEEFLIYKLRTLKFAIDQQGEPLPDQARLSRIGRLLRQLRLDEFPQLFNVMTGDMALIGPRPLLPQDQPTDPTVRLSVRPGLTGWAQVNGGTLLSPEEKDKLDAWYVRNASLWLDGKIIGMTLGFLVYGERRREPIAMPERRGGRAPRIAWRGTAPARDAVLPREESGN